MAVLNQRCAVLLIGHPLPARHPPRTALPPGGGMSAMRVKLWLPLLSCHSGASVSAPEGSRPHAFTAPSLPCVSTRSSPQNAVQ